MFCSPGDFSKAIRRPLSMLKNSVPGFFEPGELLDPDVELPDEIPFATAAKHSERAYVCKTQRPAVYRERVDGYRAAYHHDVHALDKRNRKSLTGSDVLGWMKGFVRVDRVVAAFNPDVAVDDLLSRVESRELSGGQPVLESAFGASEGETQSSRQRRRRLDDRFMSCPLPIWS